MHSARGITAVHPIIFLIQRSRIYAQLTSGSRPLNRWIFIQRLGHRRQPPNNLAGGCWPAFAPRHAPPAPLRLPRGSDERLYRYRPSDGAQMPYKTLGASLERGVGGPELRLRRALVSE